MKNPKPKHPFLVNFINREDVLEMFPEKKISSITNRPSYITIRFKEDDFKDVEL